MSQKEVSPRGARVSLKKPKAVVTETKRVLIKKIEVSASKKATEKKIAIKSEMQKGSRLFSKNEKAVIEASMRTPKVAPLPKVELVVVPSNMSIRAREKALAILQKMSEDFDVSAQKMAYGMGLCLVLLGGSMSLLSSGYFPQVQRQIAQVISTASSTIQTATQNTITLVIPAPAYTITAPLPPEIHGTVDSSFTLKYADNVDIKLYSLDSGRLTSVSYDKPAADTYHFRVSQANLNPGTYITRISARALVDQSVHTFPGNQFIIPAVVQTSTAVNTTNPVNNTTGTTSNTTTSAGTATVTTGSADTTVATSTPVVQEKLEVKVVLPSGTLSGNSILKAIAPDNTLGTLFFIRPIKTVTLSQLGTATKGTNNWYYLFNTINKPNGEYEILARAKVNDGYLISQPVRIKIENFGQTVVAAQPINEITPEPVPVTAEHETLPIQGTIAKPPVNVLKVEERSFVNLDEKETPASPAEKIQPLSKESSDLLEKNRDELTELFERYAVATQSGSQLTIQLALKELEAARSRIVTEAIKNPELSNEASKIGLEFSEHIDMLKNRIEIFEKLRKSSSKEDTHTDTDGDGVSDFDEQNLYRTDAHNPDTDHDGFMDGTEIMRGFDPTDAKAEVTVTYEMPQQSLGLVHDDILKIENVKPLITHDESGKTLEVQAEIRGKALPNSYVTLYIFSTPVVVTVRTDKDGSFVYNFEKELSDGEHEVYVAVTDNTGAIVARSNPFKFVKEAQAFTPVDTVHAETADSKSLSDFKLLNMYNVAVGLGVLALGLVLLMLGIGLRKKTPPDVIVSS